LLTDIQDTKKRQHIESLPHAVNNYDFGARPACKWSGDVAYLTRTINELKEAAKSPSATRGSDIAKVLLSILENCKLPCTEGSAADCLLLEGLNAKNILDSKTPDIPIITTRQQPFKWDNQCRPILKFFECIADHNREVSVQIPSLSTKENSFRPHTIKEVYQRFSIAEITNDL
jgi:hypothetical protein